MKKNLQKGAFFVLLAVLLIAAVFIYKRSYAPATTTPITSEGTVTQETVTPPAKNQISLNIISPQDGAVVTSASVTASGKTVPKADVIINDIELKANAQGNFSTTIILDEGENTITVVANDENGNFAEKEITVTYNAGETF